MDQIYFWILILLFVILILDYSDKYLKRKQEHFINNQLSDTTVPPYYEENRLYTYEIPYTSNAVNITTGSNLHFKNFGTNGIEPPYLKCPSCNLQFDCSNYPYDVDEKNANVCTKCYEKISLDNNNLPVYAKTVGRPRVCKKLID
jgi:hypothetical protein